MVGKYCRPNTHHLTNRETLRWITWPGAAVVVNLLSCVLAGLIHALMSQQPVSLRVATAWVEWWQSPHQSQSNNTVTEDKSPGVLAAHSRSRLRMAFAMSAICSDLQLSPCASGLSEPCPSCGSLSVVSATAALQMGSRRRRSSLSRLNVR